MLHYLLTPFLSKTLQKSSVVGLDTPELCIDITSFLNKKAAITSF